MHLPLRHMDVPLLHRFPNHFDYHGQQPLQLLTDSKDQLLIAIILMAPWMMSGHHP